MRIMGAWWVVLCAVLAIACGQDGQAPGARLRAVALAEPDSRVEITVDGHAIARGRAREVLGTLWPVSAGMHDIAVRLEDREFRWRWRIELDLDYTAILNEGLPPVMVADDPADDEPVAPALTGRFVHGSTTAGLVDVYLSAPDSRLAGAEPTTFDLDNGDVTGFETLSGGRARLRVTRATEVGEVLFDSGPFTLPASGKLSFLLLDKVGGGLEFMVLTEEGSFNVGAFDACASDAGDDDAASARAFVGPMMMDGLCADGDVDFYKLDVPESKLAVVEVSTVELGSSLESQVELSSATLALDRASANAAGKATSRVFLFGGQTYFVKVSDAEGAGGPDYTYELRVRLLDAAPTVDAAGGGFTGGSNNPAVGGFEGDFVALAAHDEAGQALGFKSMVRVTGLGTGVYEFVFDPALASAGVLRVILGDDTGPLPHVQPRSSRAGNLSAWEAGWYVAAPTGRDTLRARRLAMSVAFPHQSLSWTVRADRLVLPAVTATQPSRTRDSLRVTFTRPARATTFEVSAFGRRSAVNGKVAAARSPVSVPLSGPLTETEAYVVRVTAGDNGLLALPLGGQARNVSEFLFYSDAE
jgi:hypothetical protein